MRFDDDEYLKQYYQLNIYPKIHDDIFELHKYVPVENVIDLGCCTGLLSRRLADKYKMVVGIEINKRYLDKAVKAPNIMYFNYGIEKDTLVKLNETIKKYGIRAIFARRVIPEIYETGGFKLVHDFIDTVFKAGVEYIAIEGRKSTRNAVNPLYSIDKEGVVFDRKYDCVMQYKNCRLLKRKE